jgi:hypothetical protein
MVEFLIKLFARAFAAKIERGSHGGTVGSALIGAIIGMASAYFLVNARFIEEDFAIARYLILTILLMILGALTGAIVGPRRSPADSRRGVQLTRYNRTAGSLTIALILLAGNVAFNAIPEGDNKDADHISKMEIHAVQTFDHPDVQNAHMTIRQQFDAQSRRRGTDEADSFPD